MEVCEGEKMGGKVEVWAEGVGDLLEAPLDPTQRLLCRVMSQKGDEEVSPMGNAKSSPICDEEEMGAEQPLDATHLTFEEVAVHFTGEEWALLDVAQRALHKEVMEENRQNVTFVEEEWALLDPSQKALHRAVMEESQRNVAFVACAVQEEMNNMEGIAARCKMEKRKPSIHSITERGKHTCKDKECGEDRTITGYRKTQRAKRRDKNFLQGNSLSAKREVIKCHSTEVMKPYKCMECGKNFREKRKLNRHQRIHTGEKPCKCMECGKGFRDSGCLARHLRTHTGEKPYKCMECGKSFKESGSFTRHLRVHTGDKPFKCLECGKKFADSRTLKLHQTIHSGEKPKKCPVCGKSFRDTGTLNKHKKRKHRGEKIWASSHLGW